MVQIIDRQSKAGLIMISQATDPQVKWVVYWLMMQMKTMITQIMTAQGFNVAVILSILVVHRVLYMKTN